MLISIVLSLLFSLMSFTFAAAELSPVVQLTAGKVQGTVEYVNPTHKAYHYQGIRYGRANRFEKPTPVEAWTDVYNATQNHGVCPQFAGNQNVPQSEDCLHLSVWQPADTKQNRSVMFWIHGGGFVGGSGAWTDARHLAVDGDVVVVGINYRLGPLGFLYTHEADGNFGLYDQLLALKWVKENIQHFGGNPNSVTIFGESAGSWSVSYQILSPLTNGLFIRAVMQSGAPNPIVHDPKDSAVRTTELFAKQFQCATTPDSALLKCLRELPLEKLHTSHVSIGRPVYGTEYLPTKPSEALQTNKFHQGLDLLFGLVDNEGTAANGGWWPDPNKVHSQEDARVELAKLENFRQRHGLGNESLDFYLSQMPKDYTIAQLQALVNRIAGDYEFDCPVVLMAEEMARHATAQQRFYSYRFMQPHNASAPLWQQVPHGSEVGYVFTGSQEIGANMVRAWSEFAKTGHITSKMVPGDVQWAEAFVDKAHPVTQFMSLHAGDYKMVKDHYKETCDTFWKPRLMI